MKGVTSKQVSRCITYVGLYVPGGTAVLPSTTLMLAVIAGCKSVVLATPPGKDGSICKEVLFHGRRPFQPWRGGLHLALRWRNFLDLEISEWSRCSEILKQQAAERGCLLIRQSLYLGDARKFVSVGGGITEVRRFHSSFHTAQSGLTLPKLRGKNSMLAIEQVPDTLKSTIRKRNKKRPILLRVLACLSLSQFINTSSVRACRVVKACCRRRRTNYSPLVSRYFYSDLFSYADENEVDKVTEKLQGVRTADGSADGAVLTTSKNEWVAPEISCRDDVAAKQVIFYVPTHPILILFVSGQEMDHLLSGI
ncbi:hypothetical protein MKW98_000075 [Papaver atlanticum]|uniref:Uncharacterized protein n=1 Tax=Papaver atlanticum TaxID=357466 RepID=A0AAD4S8V1_9MAGN|nr:hypothetical protein MKW98_000075 [Papaver atlanticum]